ncbi:MAG: hypothetical protein KF708_22875 [Pirellulales bacterium]|nr:hypothetical protein [Pirellulales bacterium]
MFRRLRTCLLPAAALVVACGAYRLLATATPSVAATESERADSPVSIVPRHNVPAVVTNEQIASILARVRPRRSVIDTNYLVHALRLWSAAADFGPDAYSSGGEMLAYCLDDRQFARVAGYTAPALVNVSSQGASVRRAVSGRPDSTTGAVHTDDLLATLAEIGVPLSTTVHGREGETTVQAMLETSLANFHSRQYEYEWTAIAAARYGHIDTPWKNSFGESLDVDDLVDELLEHPWREGVCGGTHRLEALVVLLRADETTQALSARNRRRIRQHLGAVVARLTATQNSEGYWTRDWASNKTVARSQQANAGKTSPLADRILATGHHLEWLALAPADLLPPREVIVRAGQWLARAMLEVDDETLLVEFGPFSHAARALCLWRGSEPWELWQATHAVRSAHDSST